MNTITIRETAKAMRKANVITERLLHAFLHAPIFNYTMPDKWTDDEVAWAKQNILGGENNNLPVSLPYKCFIIFCKASNTGEEDCAYFVSKDDTTVEANGEVLPCKLAIIECQRDSDDGKDYWVRACYTGSVRRGVVLSGWVNGVSKEFTKSDGTLTDLGVSMRSVITRFAYDVMSRTSCVVSVSPRPKPTKTEEWHLARTHYCVITKKQAMQIRDKRGSISSHTVRRAAHWRRAHFRLLKSEKFTNKKGQKVPVIESWVGPEEWIGMDQKIYKVIT